jgi:PAS domain S-box-containing protein
MEKALQESEKRFRGLVEHVPVGISIVSGGRLAFANPGFYALFGPVRRDCPVEELLPLLHREDREKANRLLEDAAAGSLAEGDLDLRFYPLEAERYDEQLRWGKCRASAIDFEGKAAVLMTVVDITRTKRMEELIMTREKMASLGHVAAGIAHEIRNPLSGINIFLDSILENFEDPESSSDIRELIGETQTATAKIESVIKRVLEFARPGPTMTASGDLNTPVDNAVKLSAVSLRKAHVQVEVDMEEESPILPIDAQGIEQVVLNLVNNASEALQTAHVDKVVRVQTRLQDGEALIRVADSGPGIPPEIRNRIFEPFYTTKSYGSGIGLGLCRRIVEDHGGRIDVSESALGGAEFTVRLPLEKWEGGSQESELEDRTSETERRSWEIGGLTSEPGDRKSGRWALRSEVS